MSEQEKAKQRFNEWARYALEDEQIIQIALKEGGPPNQICLHAQQMAEKFLKGFLAFHKNMPLKTHNMEHLLEECEKYQPDFSTLREDAIGLNEFYIEARYPGDVVAFSSEQAINAYKAAVSVKDFVLSKIKG